MPKSQRLWSHTYAYLLDQIHSMKAGENQLEPEEELTRKLGVSRSTVREATQALLQEGYLTRRHGKGNFAHPSVSQLRYRMDLTSDFSKLLDTGDGPVVCQTLRSGCVPCREVMRRRFPVPCTTVYELDWLYSVGERPMLFCRTSIPEEMLQRQPEPLSTDDSLFPWIRTYCGRDFAYYATHLGCRCEEDACRALQLPSGTALFNWQEVFYDLSDVPVAFCDIFFHPEHVDLTMVLRP